MDLFLLLLVFLLLFWDSLGSHYYKEDEDRPSSVITDIPKFQLKCYRQRSEDAKPLYCTWPTRLTLTENTLFYCCETCKTCPYSFPAGNKTNYTVPRDNFYLAKNLTFWVEAMDGDTKIKSEKLYIVPNNTIRYEALQGKDIKMMRLARNLILTWEKPELRKIKNEIWFWRLNSSKCKQITCNSSDLETQETCRIQLESPFAYKLQIRRILLSPGSIWSPWSETILVPAEIIEQLDLRWTLIGNFSHNCPGQRIVKLQWEPPTAPHTKVNGYSLIFQPALNQTSFTLVLRNKSMYQTAISLAPYNISIIAFNRAGTSCMESIFIPAAPPEETPFLNVTVINNQTLKASWTHHEAKFYCIVLELVKVRILSNSCQPRRELKIKSKTGMFQKVFEGLQPLRFYRVTVHTNGFRKRKGCQSVGGYTIGSGSACTQQLPPTHGPRKVNVTNIRKHSALLEWKEMPLEQCQGSMQKYLIIYRDHWNHTHTASVNSSTLSFTLLSLNASSLYTVEICAVTTAGIGANTLRNFQTKEYDGNELTVIVVVTAICVMFGVFAIAAVCQYSIKRSKRIIFPKIPDPVNSLVVKSFHNHPSTKLWASSSDDQDVADVLVVMVTVQSDTTTASVNEKDEDELISLGEGEICPSYSSGSNTPFQYRRQMGTTMGMDDDLCSESEFKQNLETEATELINSKFHHLCLPSYTASAPNLCTNISLLAMYDQNVSKEEAEEGNAE